MMPFSLVRLIFVLFTLYAVPASALLSAENNRLDMMLESCQKELNLSQQNCQCIFTTSHNADISNNDLAHYFTNDYNSLSGAKFAYYLIFAAAAKPLAPMWPISVTLLPPLVAR